MDEMHIIQNTAGREDTMPGIDKKLMAELEEYIRIYYIPEEESIKKVL